MCTSCSEEHSRKASLPMRRSFRGNHICFRCEQCEKVDPHIAVISVPTKSTICNRLQFSHAMGPTKLKSAANFSCSIPDPQKLPSGGYRVQFEALAFFLHEWRRHVCGVHRSSWLKVEAPHIQKHENRKEQTNQDPKTTQQQEKQARTAEFHLCTSMVKHGEKRELRLIATWASNSISRCCRIACEGALCDRPVCGQAWSQALADASAQAI